jgi:hypothetical protein
LFQNAQARDHVIIGQHQYEHFMKKNKLYETEREGEALPEIDTLADLGISTQVKPTI